MIQYFLDMWVIDRVPQRQMGSRVYRLLFLVSKKNGKMGAIFDLKWLNWFLKEQRFKMETWKLISFPLETGDILVSIDLSNNAVTT